jgi:hypothetical protein
VRIRIALVTAMAVTCMTTAIFVSIGSTPGASASDAARVTASNRHAAPSSNANLAALAVPVLVHTAAGLVIDVGDSHFPASVPVAAPVVTPPPPPVPVTDDNSVATADWQCIRVHESGDNYNDPNMPSGAYGILISTWQSFGYSGWPYQAAPAVQDALALRLHSMYGFDPWSSRFACGL